MGVPKGLERFYPEDVLLLLLRTLYGLKQAAMQFWRELQKAFVYMRYKRNKADPCLAYKWVDGFLVIWLSWVDDCLNAGPTVLVKDSTKQMKFIFECVDLGEMDEYVGCKVDYNKEEGFMKLTQPVLLQSYEDEFDLDEGGHAPKTPAKTGQ
eukprot:15326342-Ditylum_brightwellii.AAC.1